LGKKSVNLVLGDVCVYFVMCMSKQSGVIGPNSAFVMYS
jgi:hypothetical protein